ncbi:MAG TPA: low molecular weight protein-tyrosine-phosphatase [Jatrophihabitantaceae bacterium]|jgi:protein-tyrosine phosphatase
MAATGVLFVCMGNICRSPTAEAVFVHLAADKGMAEEFRVDSAGTGDWHRGQSPDPRAVAAGARAGYQVGGRARVVTGADFDDFDVIVAVDDENLAALRAMAPAGSRAAVRKLSDDDVPDPYYGGDADFDDVVRRIEQASARLLDDLRQG